MFNSTNHYANAYQSHNDLLPHTHQENHYKKNHTGAGKDVEQLENLCIIGGNIKWFNHYRTQYGGSFKNKKWMLNKPVTQRKYRLIVPA